MSSDYIAASEAAIKAGRQHYAAKRYKPALEQFTRAMKLCPCARGMKRERCSCKNFEEVASKGESIFKEAMYNCKCPVGQTFNKCDKAMHIQALDYRAATFEALQELDRARRDAEWILELAPRLPDGYLRLGKIVRLQKKPEFAWKVYNAGIEVGVANGTSKSQKMEQLYKARQPLQMRFNREDPITFPIEIVQLIFSYMDLASLIRCLRVCKTWKEALTSGGNERLWRVLEFPFRIRKRPPPRTNGLRKLLAYSNNDVRELVIGNAIHFGLTQSKFLMLLNSSKNLERLEISTPCEPLEITIDLKNLKQLYLSGFDAYDDYSKSESNYFHKLMVMTAPYVEKLCLSGAPLEWSTVGDTLIPMMPNLKFLRLIGSGIGHKIPVPIIDILRRSPNLEQLFLTNPKIDGADLNEVPWDGYGPNLKVVRIAENRPRQTMYGEEALEDAKDAYRVLAALNRGKTFQHLDISYDWKYNDNDPFFHEILVGDFRGELVAYENLQSFRVQDMVLDPQKAQRLFETSISEGKMHTFDIVFPQDPLQGQSGQGTAQHIEGYKWLQGAESIRCMGVFDFSCAPFYSQAITSFVAFLASFPNLEVLEIDSMNYQEPELFGIIRDILKVTKLKILFQRKVTGVLMDQLEALTASHGVELFWGERPREWPYRLD